MQASSLTSKIAGAAMFAAAATGLVYPATAEASPPISQTECSAIAATGVDVIRALGPNTVSVEFKQSFRNFLGRNLSCDGPKDIATPTVADVAAFDTIMSQLESLKDPHPIYLQRAGVRSVDPSKVASNASVVPVVQPQ